MIGCVLVLTGPLALGQEPKAADRSADFSAMPITPLPPISPSDDAAQDPNGAAPASAPGTLRRSAGGAMEEPGDLPIVIGAKPRTAAASPAAGDKGTRRLVPAPRDDAVQRVAEPAAADGAKSVASPLARAAAPAGQGGAAPPEEESGEGSSFVLPPDRLTLGKQEVVLSVDVQAPANMIFNRDSIVKIVVKNSGSTDAQGVMVRDRLPAGLAYVSSQPAAQQVGESLLSWRISALPAGSDRTILLKVRPTKTDGAFDHAATVTFQAGSKATSRVLRPRLKLEVVQAPIEGKVLKNKTAEFRIAITNSGNGPARNVIVKAKLSAGLRHDTGERNEDNSFELPIQELRAGQREDLDPLTVEAIQGGDQTCTVTATSEDVDVDKEAAEVVRNVTVVEPKLTMTLTGPDKRFTDTIANYAIALENPGTAPARNVKVLATLGVSGRLMAIPQGAKYDTASRRLQWTIPQIDPGEKPRP